MDLMYDYAFKLFFSNRRRLILLLNAIFANKNIPRVIEELTIIDPSVRKKNKKDKHSIIDLQAKLSDGLFILIEIHLYDFIDFKYKSVRNWARIFSSELEEGQDYIESKPVICISFLYGPISDKDNNPIDNVHSLFHIMERDSGKILVPDMELHYINMQAFVKEFNTNIIPQDEPELDMFTLWLALITQEKITDKKALSNIYQKEREIMMAVKELSRMSQDKQKWLAYQRRLDEINSHALMKKYLDESVRRADMFEQRANVFEQRAIKSDQRADMFEQRAIKSDSNVEALIKFISDMGISEEEIKRKINLSE